MTNLPLNIAFINGRLGVRLWGMPLGQYMFYETRIDSVIDHIRRELGMPMDCGYTIFRGAGIDPTAFSHCRAGRVEIQDAWLVRLRDFSGIPVDELRAVAGMQPATQPHPNARRDRKQRARPKVPAVPDGFGFTPKSTARRYTKRSAAAAVTEPN